jgi:hypothetical protein
VICHSCFDVQEDVRSLASRAVSVRFERATAFPLCILVELKCPHGGVVRHISYPQTQSYIWASIALGSQEEALNG